MSIYSLHVVNDCIEYSLENTVYLDDLTQEPIGLCIRKEPILDWLRKLHIKVWVMQKGDLVEKLKDQSTWRLLALGLVTLGIYHVHYMHRQTLRLRDHLQPEPVVSNRFLFVLSTLAWLSAGMTVAWLLDSNSVYGLVGDASHLALLVLSIIWGLRANQCINQHYKFHPESEYWLGQVGTVLLTPLYFNYKINHLNEIFAVPEHSFLVFKH